jgi:glutathione S-transferase
MKLLSDATTPFGRKVLVAALERSIEIQEEFVPLDGTGLLDRYNPLRQIPTLIAEDGRAIYDSDTIILYLDTRHDGDPLVPESDRFGVLTRATLGSGLIEATLLRRMEVLREPGERSDLFIRKMEERVARTLAALEAQCATLAFTAALRADQITIACALGYVDFRYTDKWRDAHPQLAKWFGVVAKRPSMVATAPTRSQPVAAKMQ